MMIHQNKNMLTGLLLAVMFTCIPAKDQKPLPHHGWPPNANPDDIWYYFMETGSETKVSTFKRFSELLPRSAILCPKDFYIAELQYNFLDRMSEEEINERKEKKQDFKVKYAYTNTTLNLQNFFQMITTEYFQGEATANKTKERDDDEETQNNLESPIQLGIGLPGVKDISVGPKKHPNMGVPMKPRPHQKRRQHADVEEEVGQWGLGNKDGNQAQLYWPGEGHTYGPCPTLVYCLGHQACSFHLSNKLCQNDPVPGWRKTMDVTVTCQRDSSYSPELEQYLQHNPHHKEFRGELSGLEDKTVKVVYKDEVDHEVESPLTPPVLHHIHEDDVFQTECPAAEATRERGYFGNCAEPPASLVQTTKELWTVMARAPSKMCRDEILQVYCAFQYSPTGQCFPPFTQKTGGTNTDHIHPQWGLKTLPERGPRLELKHYYQIYEDKHLGLIPAKLAFFILAFEKPDSILELLKSVYKPRNYYVVHIDSKASSVRQELQVLIRQNFRDTRSIHVLPADRSFYTSWGSWYIMRAQLECIEELLRMGLWDFAINLSGSDLPLRDMDDLSALLAPYRGRTILRVNSKLTFKDDFPVQSVWHSCNGHVYNVTVRQDPGLNLYSHSQFGIWSSDYLGMLLSGHSRAVTDKWQFALQTAFIPDEQYFGSILYDSPFKSTAVINIFTYLKPFVGETSENLCRHAEETDSCGRGPAQYTSEDVKMLQHQLHHYFFARKFSTDQSDAARQAVLHMAASNSYGREVQHNMPKVLLKTLAEKAIAKVRSAGEELGDVEDMQVVKVRVVPKLIPSDPCCEEVAKLGIQLVEEYTYWLDIKVLVKGGAGKRMIRASVDTVPSHSHTCYPGGHLRLMHATTRHDTMAAGLPRPPNKPPPRPEPVKTNLPLPTNPVGGDVIWLHTMIHMSNVSKQCSGKMAESMPARQYATWDLKQLEDFKKPPPVLNFDITLVSPTGEVLFKAARKFDSGAAGRPDPNAPGGRGPEFNMWTTPMPIPRGQQGIYTITVKEKYRDDAYSYCQSVMVMDEASPEAYTHPDVVKLWAVSDAVLLDRLDADKYYVNTPATKQTSFQSDAIHFTASSHQHKAAPQSAACKKAMEIADQYGESAVDVTFYILSSLAVIALVFVYHFVKCGRRFTPALKRSFSRRVLLAVAAMIAVQVLYFSYSQSVLPLASRTEEL